VTAVPLPDVPCVRVRTSGNLGAPGEWGNRFYLSYSGSAPSGANCATLASDIAAAWSSHIQSLISDNFALEEVDILDIATETGLSGQWTGVHSGGDSSSPLPANCAINIEYNIARRYRGGKPRIYLPPAGNDQATNQVSWAGSFLTTMNEAYTAYIDEIEALSIGSMGTLNHVNLSYYKGFTNITNSSGRERAVPTYRATALHDNVVGYSTKTIIGSQRRRRTATTP